MDASAIIKLLIDLGLFVLIAVAVWLVIELALTIKNTRKVVDSLDSTVNDLNASVNETITSIQPVIKRLDTTVDNLQPSIQEVQPLLQKAGGTVDALSQNLLRLEEVIADVSSVTSTAANASIATNDLAANASNVANSVLMHIKSRFGASDKDVNLIQEVGEQVEEKLENISNSDVQERFQSADYLILEKNAVSDDDGYFMYPHQNK